LCLIILIFGVGKLGQVGGSLGKSIREFRREKDKKDDSEAAPTDAKSEKPAAKSSKEKFCPGCGNKISANAKFCMECGANLGDFS